MSSDRGGEGSGGRLRRQRRLVAAADRQRSWGSRFAAVAVWHMEKFADFPYEGCNVACPRDGDEQGRGREEGRWEGGCACLAWLQP